MTTILILLGVLAVGAGVYFYAIKTGKIEDADGDYIADEAEDIAKEIKRRAKNVKAELADVKKAAKQLADQAEDVVEAAKGKKSTRRKTAPKKATKVTKGSGSGSGKVTKGSGSGKGKGKAKVSKASLKSRTSPKK